METKINKNVVVYFSPSGNTAKVADIIVDALKQTGEKTIVLNLIEKDEPDYKKWASDTLNPGDCLWVGSPVYAHHALPQVMDFISGLPVIENCYVVPFVTYGAVTSGMALFEMGRMLTEKGFKVPGAAKVPTLHSMMWMFQNPLGEGRPNKEDESVIRDLVKAVYKKLSRHDTAKYLTSDQLNYQLESSRKKFNPAGIATTKKIFPPMKFNADLCTECNICEQECPTRNIALEPSFRFKDNCIFCFNCVRNCETKAITNDIFNVIEGKLKMLAEEYSEPSVSRIFF